MHYKNEIIREFENYYIEVEFLGHNDVRLEFEIEEKFMEEYAQIIHKMIENGIQLDRGSMISDSTHDASKIAYLNFQLKQGKLLVRVTMN